MFSHVVHFSLTSELRAISQLLLFFFFTHVNTPNKRRPLVNILKSDLHRRLSLFGLLLSSHGTALHICNVHFAGFALGSCLLIKRQGKAGDIHDKYLAV